jgi:hypothetical protein
MYSLFEGYFDIIHHAFPCLNNNPGMLFAFAYCLMTSQIKTKSPDSDNSYQLVVSYKHSYRRFYFRVNCSGDVGRLLCLNSNFS